MTILSFTFLFIFTLDPYFLTFPVRTKLRYHYVRSWCFIFIGIGIGESTILTWWSRHLQVYPRRPPTTITLVLSTTFPSLFQRLHLDLLFIFIFSLLFNVQLNLVVMHGWRGIVTFGVSWVIFIFRVRLFKMIGLLRRCIYRRRWWWRGNWILEIVRNVP
jgi:small basic protein